MFYKNGIFYKNGQEVQVLKNVTLKCKDYNSRTKEAIKYYINSDEYKHDMKEKSCMVWCGTKCEKYQYIDLGDVCGIVTSCIINENDEFIINFDLLDTCNGKIIKDCLDNDVHLDIFIHAIAKTDLEGNFDPKTVRVYGFKII